MRLISWVDDVQPFRNPVREGLPTLPANLCPFSGRRELARFSEDFGEAVGETVKAKARSTVW